MPITVRKFNAQVKDPESGDMIPAGLLSSDALGAINSAKTDAVAAVEGKQAVAEAAIELKGQTTIASIPDDYTALSNEVDDVKTQISDFAEPKEIIDDTVQTPTYQSGYVGLNGNSHEASSYVYTSKIDVEPGDNVYLIMTSTGNPGTMRYVTAYNSSDVAVSAKGAENVGNAGFTVPDDIAKIIVSIYGTDTTGNSYAIHVKKTSEKYVVIGLDELEESVSTIEDDIVETNNKIEAIAKSELFVTVDGTDITIISKYGNKNLKRTANIKPNANKTFEFGYAYVVDGENETTIKASTDDITPLRLKWGTKGWTIGSNHGWFAFSVAKGSLTIADIGSTWTSGGNTYTLAAVDGTRAYFIPEVTLANHIYTFSNTVPTNDLVHSSGATHTGNVSVSGAESSQLYPSLNKHTIRYLKDGYEFDAESFWCTHFTVIEEYTIIDYASIGNYLHNHIGSEIGDNIDGCVRVSISYDFVGSACVITTSYETLKEINYFNCGTIQAQGVGATGTNKRYFYVNNQSDNATLKSSTLLDTTNYSSGIEILKLNAIDPSIATNRFVEIVKDTGGNMLYGFAIGYLPDISSGEDEQRKSISLQGEFRETTLKAYPVAIMNIDASVGDFFTVCAYRNYIEPSELTNISFIMANNAAYLIIDAHTQQNSKSIQLPTKFIGKSISTIETHNFTLKSTVVGASGVTFSTSSSYGCAVLKIS